MGGIWTSKGLDAGPLSCSVYKDQFPSYFSSHKFQQLLQKAEAAHQKAMAEKQIKQRPVRQVLRPSTAAATASYEEVCAGQEEGG